MLCVTPFAAAQGAVLSAAKAGDAVVVESRGSALTYRAVVDGKHGGDISQIRLPADGQVVAREVNDIFFLGQHAEDFTLRGWSGPEKFNIACAVELVSQKPDEVVVRVNLLTTGTFKILAKDPAEIARLRKTHPSYKEKTLQLKRTYTFKPDRVVVDDELLWVYPQMGIKTFYFTAAFLPGVVQGPLRLVSGTNTTAFYQVSSGGKKVPPGIVYPCTAENFLKNGYKVSVRATSMSFDADKSDFYFYEKSWQQDWNQLSGFMYRVGDRAAGQPIRTTHEVVFSKATAAEMPPVVTIHSPAWDARWMAEKGEVARYTIGETVKLAASAVNSDGTAVPGDDIAWEIHIDPWWNTPAVTLHGANPTYTLPDATDEVDKATSKDRALLAVINVRVRGKNGTEAVEPFAMLVGRPKR